MPAFTKSQSQECNKIQKISTKHKICFSFKTLFLCFTIISSNVEDLVFNIVDFASYIVWILFVCLSTCIFIFNCHAFMNSLSLLIYNVNSGYQAPALTRWARRCSASTTCSASMISTTSSRKPGLIIRVSNPDSRSRINRTRILPYFKNRDRPKHPEPDPKPCSLCQLWAWLRIWFIKKFADSDMSKKQGRIFTNFGSGSDRLRLFWQAPGPSLGRIRIR